MGLREKALESFQDRVATYREADPKLQEVMRARLFTRGLARSRAV